MPSNNGDDELTSVAKRVGDDDPAATLSKELLGEVLEDNLTAEFGNIAGSLAFLRIIIPPVLVDAFLVIDPDEEGQLIVLDVLVIPDIFKGDFSLSDELLTNFKVDFDDWKDLELPLEGPSFIFFEMTLDLCINTLPAKSPRK